MRIDKLKINKYFHLYSNKNEVVFEEVEEPEPKKKGKWLGYNADKPGWLRTDGTPIFLICAECNGTVINNGSAHWNYCPNCGCDMRGEQE